MGGPPAPPGVGAPPAPGFAQPLQLGLPPQMAAPIKPKKIEPSKPVLALTNKEGKKLRPFTWKRIILDKEGIFGKDQVANTNLTGLEF